MQFKPASAAGNWGALKNIADRQNVTDPETDALHCRARSLFFIQLPFLFPYK